MAAANTDLLKKLSRRWTGQIGAAGVADASTTTVPLASVTNLATDTAVVAVIDRVDANGVATPSLEETVIGVVSGSNLANCVRGAEGTAQAHSAGAVVEILVTAKGWNDLVDMLLVQHNQLGLHTNITASNITASGTLSSTRITKRVYSTTTLTTLTPEISTYDIFHLTAQASAITIANHSTSTPNDGDMMLIRLLDNGTARAITFGDAYVAKAGTALPTTTTLSKNLSMLFQYNSNLSKWNLLASGLES